VCDIRALPFQKNKIKAKHFATLTSRKKNDSRLPAKWLVGRAGVKCFEVSENL